MLLISGIAIELIIVLLPVVSPAQTYYVTVGGNDTSGDGSAIAPWATITHALDNAVDGSTILVRPGTYSGRVRLRGTFESGVVSAR